MSNELDVVTHDDDDGPGVAQPPATPAEPRLKAKTRKEFERALSTLNPDQYNFVMARLGGLNPVASARAAGYGTPEVNAYRVEKNPKVMHAINVGRRITAERYDLTRDDVLRGMFDAVAAASTSADLVAAWREIGKLIGAYEPVKLELTHKLEDMTVDRLRRMTTEELQRLAGTGEWGDAASTALEAEYEVLGTSVDPHAG